MANHHPEPHQSPATIEPEPKRNRGQTQSDPVFIFPDVRVAPLLNSLSNPRLAGLHGSDFMQLIASDLCFGFGVLFGGLKFGE